jgi:hypothetical protein
VAGEHAILELFTDRIMTETESHGASLHWKKGPFPMDLSVNQSRFKQWGFESRSDAKMSTLDYAIRNAAGKWMQSELRYNYRDYEETFDANAEFFDTHRRTRLKSHDLNFTNSIYLDPSRRSYLTSIARMYKQFGSQEFDNLSWQERLNLQHTPNLRSYYLFDYMQTKLHDETVDSYRDPSLPPPAPRAGDCAEAACARPPSAPGRGVRRSTSWPRTPPRTPSSATARCRT